jgi:RND family efflux transporter, MFP subunit
VKARHLIFLFVLALPLAACGGNAGTEPSHEESAGGHAESGHDTGHGDEAEAGTVIEAAIAEASGIRVAPAGPGVIADEHEVQGLLTPVEGRIAKVTARFPGPIRRLAANVGDRVVAGQALAVIESNLSLTNYTVTSPIAGVVLERNAAVGAVAGEGMPLFEVADLSSLWVDLHVFGFDAQHITAGVPVTVTRLSDGANAQTRLERVLPSTATASQSTVARATIANDDGLWRPGSAVRARIAVAHSEAALVVPLSALQTDEGNRDVVYVRAGDRYEERPVTLDRRDARHVEVTAGLRAGEQVVVEQSFLVKADIGKSAAEHEH